MPTFGVARLYGKDMNVLLQNLKTNSVEAYEIGFAYGVDENLPEETVKLADTLGIRLSGHIPFFISWMDQEKKLNSIKHLVKGMSFAAKLQTIAVCHLGYYGGKSFQELRSEIIKGIREALAKVTERSYLISGPVIGLETTGKKNEIGTLDEILSIVNALSIDVAIPVIDWAHLFARSNGQFPLKTDDFLKTLYRLEKETSLKKFYFHASGIEYKDGSEKKHQSAKSCQPPLPYLFSALNKAGYDYTLIVESPEAIADLTWLKEVARNPEAWFTFAQKQLGTALQEKLKGASSQQIKLSF